jgi:heptosyltransferase II
LAGVMKTILIIKLAALGDVLRTTSILQPLAQRYPRASIHWLTSESARPLLTHNPWIDRIYGEKELRSSSFKKQFDLVLSLEENRAAGRLALRACSGKLIGVYTEAGELRFTESSRPLYGMSLLNRDADGGLKTANALKRANRRTYAELLLQMLGLPCPADRSRLKPVLRLTLAERRRARRWAQRRGLSPKDPLIGVNPGAGHRWESKQLSSQATVALLQDLGRRTGRPLILFGGREEATRNRHILRQTYIPVFDSGTDNNLRSFAALIDLCDVVISTDSLAFHIATALSKKVVVLVGPTQPHELDTFGRGIKVLPAKPCRCFYRNACRWKISCLNQIPARTLSDVTMSELKR